MGFRPNITPTAIAATKTNMRINANTAVMNSQAPEKRLHWLSIALFEAMFRADDEQCRQTGFLSKCESGLRTEHVQ
jgi:hypothetical protein